MTPDQIKLVQDSWAKVLPISEAAAAIFYDRLFELDPSLRFLFKVGTAEQGRKLMAMINTAVSSLARLDTIVPAVQALGARHSIYGVRDKDYDTVASALLWTLERGLGPAFDPATKAAWVETYTILAGVMKQAASAKLVA